MTVWTEQINKHEVVLPNGITSSMNGKIPQSLLADVFNGHGVRIGRLCKPAARSWAAMVRQALLDGVPADQITATDTYRTYESQLNLWNTRYDHTDHHNGGRTCGGDHRFLKEGMATAACPGTSNHGKACACDKGNGPLWHAWLEVYGHLYGWEWELKSEKWHIHYWPGDNIPEAVLNHDYTEADLMAESAILVHVVQPGHAADNKVFFILGNIRNWLEDQDQVDTTKKLFNIDEMHDINGHYYDIVIEPMTADSMTGMRDLPPDRRTQISNMEKAINTSVSQTSELVTHVSGIRNDVSALRKDVDALVKH